MFTINDLLRHLNVDLETLLRMELGAVLAALSGGGVVDSEVVHPALAEIPLPTLLRTDLNGNEYAPAWDACNALWGAAQREGVFSMTKYVGGGIKPGAQQLTEKSPVTQRQVEDKIVELGLSDWGRRWMANDRNAQYIGAPYCYLFTEARGGKPALDPDFPHGYSVHRKHQNDEAQGFVRKARV